MGVKSGFILSLLIFGLGVATYALLPGATYEKTNNNIVSRLPAAVPVLVEEEPPASPQPQVLTRELPAETKITPLLKPAPIAVAPLPEPEPDPVPMAGPAAFAPATENIPNVVAEPLPEDNPAEALPRDPVESVASAQVNEPTTIHSEPVATTTSDLVAPPEEPGPISVAENEAGPELEEPSASSLPSSPLAEGPVSDQVLIRDFWVWAGGGPNFTSVKQSIPGMSDASFGKIQGPSVSAGMGFFTSDHLGFDFGYRSSPGEVTGSGSISVVNTRYNWKELSAQLLYRPNPAGGWLWRAGIEQQELPFLVPLSTNRITVTDLSVRFVTLGLEYRKERKKVRINYGLRILRPISESVDLGESIDLSPKIALEAAVGAAYEIKPDVSLGINFRTQYHENSFQYKNASGSAAGKESAISSGVDLRLGVEF